MLGWLRTHDPQTRQETTLLELRFPLLATGPNTGSTARRNYVTLSRRRRRMPHLYDGRNLRAVSIQGLYVRLIDCDRSGKPTESS
jgi:hypothetical protein